MERRRMYRSKKMYDLCFRALQGLPLPPRELTTLLLESIMARLMRTKDVVLCHGVWMNNHPHMQLYSLDLTALSKFHEGLKKRTTDFLKRLLGVSKLGLWDDNSMVGEVLDLDAAIDRIAYCYANPVRAKIASSIDTYQGFNTWKEFLAAKPSTNAFVEKEVVWLQLPDIKQPLSSPNPSLKEERKLIENLKAKAAKRTHTLRIYPFKWLEAFKVTEPEEIENVRQRIIKRVREEEQKHAPKKAYPCMLEGFNITNSYIPPKKERMVFMFGSTVEIRCGYLELYDRFRDRCRRCYQLMRQGATDIDWPPECFRPPAPRLVNVW